MYWRQERNGMWMRVAILAKLFEVHQEILRG
jgi:aspartate carbamoyltransferase catalytic subunit